MGVWSTTAPVGGWNTLPSDPILWRIGGTIALCLCSVGFECAISPVLWLVWLESEFPRLRTKEDLADRDWGWPSCAPRPDPTVDSTEGCRLGEGSGIRAGGQPR